MGSTRLYRRLYGGAAAQPRGRKIVFERLPLLRKQLIREASPFDLLAAPLAAKVTRYAETTGSMGSPTPSFFTPTEFRGSVALARLTPYSPLLRQAARANRRAVCGLACGFTIAGASFHQILDAYGFLTVNVDARTTIAPPARVARLLARYRPSVVVASETDFLAWMRVLREDCPESYDDVVEALQVLISTAELCSGSRSARIGEHFGILHVDNYSCVEGFFSLPCPCGEKHVLPIYHAEVLSEDLSAGSEWGTGRFAFTNLVRRSTPFVRYLLDDWVTIAPSRCPYGFRKSVVPHGRYELSVLLGEERCGVRHFEEALFAHHLFGEYTVEVRQGRLVVRAEDYDEGSPVPVAATRNEMERRFGVPVDLEVLPYGALRSYREIRMSKPLMRVRDLRASSTQRVPEYV
jgi:phenylacetate-CoA ligase